MERDGRIELPILGWKPKVMPFYESRNIQLCLIIDSAYTYAVGPQDDNIDTIVNDIILMILFIRFPKIIPGYHRPGISSS
jgi:hypothetical protein